MSWNCGTPKNCQRKKKACKGCGKEFEPDHGKTQRCEACRKSYWKEYNKKQAKKNYRKGKSLECKNCQKEFTVNAYFNPKYCSVKCRADDLKRLGKDSPNYKHGLFVNRKTAKIYHHKEREFEKTAKVIKQRIKDANGGYLRCERCKTTSSQLWDVHHIVYRSEAPKHENLHNPANLILLCRLCHGFMHSKKSNREALVKERKLHLYFNHLPKT